MSYSCSLDFSDQFSYIKYFYLSYHLKVIKIIVFIKTEKGYEGLIRVQRLQAVGFKRPEPLDALATDPLQTPFIVGRSTARDKRPPLLSRVVPRTAIKGVPFIAGGATTHDKRGVGI